MEANKKFRIGELEKITPEKKKWIEALRVKVIAGEIRREHIEVIPIRVYGGYCGRYVVCDVYHPSECSYEIISWKEWKKHYHAEKIINYLNDNPNYVVHRLDEVLERLYEEEKTHEKNKLKLN